MARIKVAVNGAMGRMGSESVRAIEADSELELVASADRGDDLAQIIKQSGAQVVVDFTLASVGFEMARTIIEAGARPVIGTSGLKQGEVNELRKLTEQKGLGGLIVPNFAIGAVLMMKFSKAAAKYLPSVEIIETHHDGKEDAPSGTALRTAELIAEGRVTDVPIRKERILLEGARGGSYKEVPIHSVRIPGVVARQQVVFGGKGQTLTILHDSIDRTSFMPGVVLACKKAPELNTLVYGLEEIL